MTRSGRNLVAYTYRDAVVPCIVVLLITLHGCTQPIRSWSPDVDHEELDATAFLHYLSTVPVATVDEALRAVLLVADGEDRFSGYEDRLGELTRRKAIRPEWIDDRSQLLDRGTLAYMLRRVCRIRPSTNEVLLGSWGLGDRRYAVRTCVDAGILHYGAAHEAVCGGELLAAISCADEYLERNADRTKPGR